MNLKSFKNEFRLICTDTWGDAMNTWFECAGWINWRGIPTPKEWEYSPGLGGDGREEDNYFYELFESSSDEELIAIGNFLFRYCQYLKFKEIDY